MFLQALLKFGASAPSMSSMSQLVAWPALAIHSTLGGGICAAPSAWRNVKLVKHRAMDAISIQLKKKTKRSLIQKSHEISI